MVKPFSIFCFAILSIVISGCASFRFSPQEYPVIEKTSGGLFAPRGIGVIATTATRRVIVINKKEHTFCAEPSPDASNNIISTVESILSASTSLEGLSIQEKANLEKMSAEAKANFTRNLNSTVNQLFKPTQGLKVLRDGWFAICQAQVNGMMTKDQFLSQFKDLLGKIFGDSKLGAIGLIESEFNYQIDLAKVNKAANEKLAEAELVKYQVELSKIEKEKEEIIKSQLELKLKIEKLAKK